MASLLLIAVAVVVLGGFALILSGGADGPSDDGPTGPGTPDDGS